MNALYHRQGSDTILQASNCYTRASPRPCMLMCICAIIYISARPDLHVFVKILDHFSGKG